MKISIITFVATTLATAATGVSAQLSPFGPGSYGGRPRGPPPGPPGAGPPGAGPYGGGGPFGEGRALGAWCRDLNISSSRLPPQCKDYCLQRDRGPWWC